MKEKKVKTNHNKPKQYPSGNCCTEDLMDDMARVSRGEESYLDDKEFARLTGTNSLFDRVYLKLKSKYNNLLKKLAGN